MFFWGEGWRNLSWLCDQMAEFVLVLLFDVSSTLEMVGREQFDHFAFALEGVKVFFLWLEVPFCDFGCVFPDEADSSKSFHAFEWLLVASKLFLEVVALIFE